MWRRHNLGAAQEIIVDAAAASSDLDGIFTLEGAQTKTLKAYLSGQHVFLLNLFGKALVKHHSVSQLPMGRSHEANAVPRTWRKIKAQLAEKKSDWFVWMWQTEDSSNHLSSLASSFQKLFMGSPPDGSMRYDKRSIWWCQVTTYQRDHDELQIKTLLIPRRTTVHSSPGLYTVYHITRICNQEEDNYEVTLHTSATKT